MKYIFGPVNSRRLGRSLGVDLVPHKVCTLNCCYCECGETTELTDSRREYVSADSIMEELDSYLVSNPELDVITFSGSGEPTLNLSIGKVIHYIKEKYPQYPVCVLTNGTTLYDPDVRSAILQADIVIPSLDAVREETFKRMLCPAPGISADRTVRGIISFAEEYRGELILEVFIIPGLNDADEDIRALKEAVLKINPSFVQLNRLDRPGRDRNVKRATDEDLERIASFLYPVQVKIPGVSGIAKPPGKGGHKEEDAILALLKRRHATVEDISVILGLEPGEADKLLKDLRHRGILQEENFEGRVYYRID